jgi:hypothetical protein
VFKAVEIKVAVGIKITGVGAIGAVGLLAILHEFMDRNKTKKHHDNNGHL